MLLFGTLFWRTGAGTPTPPPPPAAPQEQPKGRAEWLGDYLPDRRDPEQIRRDRQRFGIIPPDVREVIDEVAARQAQRLEQDKQRQLDELRGELRLRELDLRAGYLEALGEARQKLIEEEIKRRLAQLSEDEQVILLVMLAAGAVL